MKPGPNDRMTWRRFANGNWHIERRDPVHGAWIEWAVQTPANIAEATRQTIAAGRPCPRDVELEAQWKR